ncbi:hypothetical protein LS72_004895 [Helicobacter apodemus]|uniref:Uncharacterized protein n=1 Tax=Helicobacter apodemus TaxID=135569 RepID=A0A4U8UFP3_9HELI|nr:hypothetical protein [Helicobacter apodemus]TLE16063.1 hypothetical protein LS72_004895 [Helicobacter apodemus]
MKNLLIIFFTITLLSAQPWVMFNDLDDTYLYDQASGQVYIRIKKGGKNYEDTFVKMGIIDNNNSIKSPQQPTQNTTKEQKELLKKAQEAQRSIQESIFQDEK